MSFKQRAAAKFSRFKKIRSAGGVETALLLLLAFVPRVVLLGNVLVNVDAPRWNYRSAQFFDFLKNASFADTIRSAHPGATVMWLAGFGFEVLNQVWKLLYGLRIPHQFGTYPLIYFSNKILIVVVNSLLVVAAYLLLRQLCERKTALIAGVLLAINPFYIALSRALHLDALLSGFLLCSVLAFYIYMRRNSDRYLYLSAVFGGLAVLTKVTSLFLLPFLCLVMFFSFFLGPATAGGLLAFGKRAVLILGRWFGVAFFVFVLLLPAMWVAPLDTLKYILTNGVVATGLRGGGKIFFMGIQQIPGPLFYPVVFLFRTTPLTLGMLGVGLVLLVKFVRSGREDSFRVLLFSLAFMFFFTLMLSVTNKKTDRYLLPVLLTADLIAAVSLGELLKKISKRTIYAVLGLLIFVRFLQLVPVYPHYGAYANPLFGGTKTASNIFPLLWGEELREAALYLNQKENADDLVVASHNFNSLRPFLKGRVVDIYSVGEDDEIDYYLLGVRGGAEHPGFGLEKVITIGGVPFTGVFTKIP